MNWSAMLWTYAILIGFFSLLAWVISLIDEPVPTISLLFLLTAILAAVLAAGLS